MDTLFTIALFWAVLLTAMTLFGIACIKYGVYTTGDRGIKPTLEI